MKPLHILIAMAVGQAPSSDIRSELRQSMRKLEQMYWWSRSKA